MRTTPRMPRGPLCTCGPPHPGVLDEKATALGLVHVNETINFALASLFNFVFAAVTFILFGLAVALSNLYPRWPGWVAFVAGIASIVAGLIQAYVDEPLGASRVLTISDRRSSRCGYWWSGSFWSGRRARYASERSLPVREARRNGVQDSGSASARRCATPDGQAGEQEQ
jgi:hypothetical protein